MAQGKIQDGDAGFLLGQNSALSPDQLPPGFYARGVNVVNRGGVVQCRPGYRCISELPEGRLQGGIFFRPKVGPLVLVFGVNGLLYISDIPFRTYRQIPGAVFSSDAQLYFKSVELSNIVNSDGSITLVEPKNLLVIQDGGFSSPVVFNGTSAETQRGAGKIPIGGPMEWVADRLWVMNGTSVFASDLGSPTSFTETNYIAGAIPFFTLPQPGTALTKTPSVELPQLLAFTGQSTTLFQAGIRDRSLWASTSEFQKEIFPKIGCVSNRSVTTHYGNLWWYSQFGYTSLDSAVQSNISSLVDYQDAEMQDSKSRLSADLSGIAAGSHENYLLVSVPHADRFNRHTWVLDSTTLVSGQRAVRSWNGVWIGTRPVQWLTDSINGVERTFYFSVDFDGVNRLWEAFTPDRLDNGCPITWWAEFRGLNISFPGKFKRFRYADLFASELSGQVDLAVFYAGSYRGRYKKILTKRIKATRGSLRSGEVVKANEKIFGLKKQSRPLRTQDAKAIHGEFGLSSCEVEAPFEEFLDESFQLLVVGSGPGAIRGYIVYAEPPENTDDSGRCEEDEVEENFVRFDGAASEAEGFSEALVEFVGDIPKYTSVQWETLSQGGFTEIGVGEAESVISQANADYVAQVRARRLAAGMLDCDLPRIVSIGNLTNEVFLPPVPPPIQVVETTDGGGVDAARVCFCAGEAGNVPIEITGGILPFTLAVDGTLPTGLSFNLSGRTLTLSGIPAAAGFTSVVAQITDSLGFVTSVTINLGVTDITTTAAPDFEEGVPYSFQFEAEGGSGSYQWGVIDGTIPAGLTFNTSGLLSGTPADSEPAEATIAVADTECDSEAPINLDFPPATVTLVPRAQLVGESERTIATVLGFSEFQVSSPPRRFLTRTWQGRLTGNDANGNPVVENEAASSELKANHDMLGDTILAREYVTMTGSDRLNSLGQMIETAQVRLYSSCPAGTFSVTAFDPTDPPYSYRLHGWCYPFDSEPGICDICASPPELSTEDFRSNFDGTSGTGHGGPFASRERSLSVSVQETINSGNFTLGFFPAPTYMPTTPVGADPLDGAAAIVTWKNDYSITLSDEFTDEMALANAVVTHSNSLIAENLPRTTGLISRWVTVDFEVRLTNLVPGEEYEVKVDFRDSDFVVTTQTWNIVSASTTYTINGSIPTPPTGKTITARNARINFAS